MNSALAGTALGRVESLHLHPASGGQPMHAADEFELVEGKGIRGNDRYFGRISRSTGQQSIRQVTLIAREQIAAHAHTLGVADIAPGAVRANIETSGVDLIALLGRRVQIGSAVLLFREARIPCAKMDAVFPGLRAQMANQRQGVLAEVVQSGSVHRGDPLTLLELAEPLQSHP